MTAMTLTPTRRTTLPVGLALGSVAGAALLVAGVWNAFIQEHVSVSSPPSLPVGATPAQAMSRYLTWYAGTVAQQRTDAIVAMVGVMGVVILADALRRRVADTNLLGRAACTAMAGGGIMWVTGQLVGIGGPRAVGLMATHGNPIQGVGSIGFTIDTITDAFSAAAFVLLGLAMVAIGIAPVRLGNVRWTALTTVTGVLSLVVAVGYLQGIDPITTYVLGALAAVLLPIWLAWTGHNLDRPNQPPLPQPGTPPGSRQGFNSPLSARPPAAVGPESANSDPSRL
jgi:hypothetical protein